MVVYHTLINLLGDLLKPLLVPRVSGTKANLKVQQHIISHFEKLNWHIQQDKFTQETPMGNVEFNNIIVTKDIKAVRRITLGAHFDSKYFADFDFIGATDSAAPCAILMDIATALNPYLSQKMETMDRFSTVQMIFFDGEEAVIKWETGDSIYGATHLAEKWSDQVQIYTHDDGSTSSLSPITQMDAMIVLDLLGTKNDQIQNSQQSTQWVWDRLVRIEEKLSMLKLVSPNLVNRNKKGLPIFVPGLPTVGEHAIQDDHYPFMLLGVPICHCIALPFPSVWHTEGDNASVLYEPMMRDLSLIYRVLVVEYLGLNDFLVGDY
ncbi:hypothetical protein BC833DRAFT_598109 [Globomyces pollinis-pini]|nr:hypothetical protein BC833DRAFT_598109 [Globomyces pollinis-pini]